MRIGALGRCDNLNETPSSRAGELNRQRGELSPSESNLLILTKGEKNEKNKEGFYRDLSKFIRVF